MIFGNKLKIGKEVIFKSFISIVFKRWIKIKIRKDFINGKYE